MKRIATREARASFLLALCAALLVAAAPARSESPAQKAAAPVRILHAMSYHTPWRWTEGQLEGFKVGLGDVKAEYKVFELDTKRHSDARQKDEHGKAARAGRAVETRFDLHQR